MVLKNTTADTTMLTSRFSNLIFIIFFEKESYRVNYKKKKYGIK